MTRSHRTLDSTCLVVAVLLGLLLAPPLGAQTLDKWTPGGDPLVLAGGPNPDYEMGGNPAVKHGADGGGFIRSVVAQPKVPGMLQAGLAAGSYVRKRVRLSGYLRTEDVSEVLTIWMGIQGQNKVLLAVADGGAIRGTTGWKKHDVVLDVPEQSVTLSLGITLEGTGKVWLDGVTVDTVGHEVAVTAQKWAFGGGGWNEDEAGGDPAVERGLERGAFIRSKVQAPKKAAALTMAASPVPYLGKRVRLSGYVKTENVEKSVGLWMIVAGPNGEMLGSDNMARRPIKGTTDSKKVRRRPRRSPRECRHRLRDHDGGCREGVAGRCGARSGGRGGACHRRQRVVHDRFEPGRLRDGRVPRGTSRRSRRRFRAVGRGRAQDVRVVGHVD